MKNFMPNKKIMIPFLLCLIASILMLITIFLPYASATEAYNKELDQTTNSILDTELGLTTDNVRNLSLYDFARLYGGNSDLFFGDSDGYVYVVIVALIGVFSAIGTILTLFKKAIPTIIFTFLATVVYLFNNYDFALRGVIPSDAYTWGFGCLVFYVAATLTIAGAIWMLIGKIKLKKETANQ